MKILLLRPVVLLCCISGYPKCFAALPSNRGLQEKLACEDEAKIEGYFLVDVVVEPSMVTASKIKVLEDNLQDAYNDIAAGDSSFRVLDSVTLLQDSIGNYGDTGSENVAGAAAGEQEVSYLFHVVGRCKGCNEMSPLLNPQADTEGRDLELNLEERTVGQGGLRKAQGEDAQDLESCAYEAPSKASFLTQYQAKHQASVSERASTSALRDIKDVLELEFQADWEPSTFTKFASTVLLKFQTAEGGASPSRGAFLAIV
jgi:hypothetical protein